MKLVFAGTTILDTTVVPPIQGNVSINGSNVVDVAQLVQATQVAIFDRGNRQNVITVKTNQYFADFPSAQYAYFTTGSYMAGSGTLVITCGEIGNTPQTATAANAVLQSVVPSIIGVNVSFTYTIICGLILGGGPPGSVTYSPLVLIPFQTAISSAANTVVVTFSTPFGAGVIPTISGIVAKGTGTDTNIFCELIKDTISNTGCTFKLSSPAPNANYVLHGSAAA